jgi:hypothetical protein
MRPAGIEPAAFRSGGERSNPLSYAGLFKIGGSQNTWPMGDFIQDRRSSPEEDTVEPCVVSISGSVS